MLLAQALLALPVTIAMFALWRYFPIDGTIRFVMRFERRGPGR